MWLGGGRVGGTVRLYRHLVLMITTLLLCDRVLSVDIAVGPALRGEGAVLREEGHVLRDEGHVIRDEDPAHRGSSSVIRRRDLHLQENGLSETADLRRTDGEIHVRGQHINSPKYQQQNSYPNYRRREREYIRNLQRTQRSNVPSLGNNNVDLYSEWSTSQDSVQPYAERQAALDNNDDSNYNNLISGTQSRAPPSLDERRSSVVLSDSKATYAGVDSEGIQVNEKEVNFREFYSESEIPQSSYVDSNVYSSNNIYNTQQQRPNLNHGHRTESSYRGTLDEPTYLTGSDQWRGNAPSSYGDERSRYPVGQYATNVRGLGSEPSPHDRMEQQPSARLDRVRETPFRRRRSDETGFVDDNQEVEGSGSLPNSDRVISGSGNLP